MRGLFGAIGLLTVLPAPPGAAIRQAWPWLPAAGALIGLCAAAAYLIARPAGPLAAAVAATAALAAISGALHLDGLADCFDAMSASASDRAIEIARDSRIGAFGAAAVSIALLAKSAALADMPPLAAARSLIAACAISRAVPLWMASLLPAARHSHMAKLAAEHIKPSTAAAGSALAAAIALLACGAAGLAALLPAAAVGWAWARWASRKLGGLTGDALGAAVESAEVSILWLLAVIY